MKRINNKGFTLIEILVSLAILGIVLAGIYSVYTMQHKSYIVQEQVAEMQQNERIALQMITRDIRMAGLGLEACPEAGVVTFQDGGAAGPDTITLAYHSFSPDGRNGGNTQASTSTAAFTTTSASVDVYDTTNFAAGDLATITSASNPCHYALICITKVISSGGSKKLQHDIGDGGACASVNIIENLPTGIVSGFSINDRVKRINSGDGGEISYAIDASLVLSRTVNGAAQPLADNIEDIQMAYGFDINGNGVVEEGKSPAGEWFDDPAGQDMARLREIRVTLVARTTKDDPEWKAGARPTVENHVPVPSAGDARYRRRVLQSTIRLRNMDGIVAAF